jgi:cytochrome c556
MKRKWTVLAASLVASALVVAGLAASAADEEETPLGKIMEKVQKDHTAILKATRTAVAWKKAQKEAAEKAEDLAKLGKDAKPFTDKVKEKKKTVEDWNQKMDDFIKEADAFAKIAAKPGTTQMQAKEAYRKVNTSCNNCHEVYREEE